MEKNEMKMDFIREFFNPPFIADGERVSSYSTNDFYSGYMMVKFDDASQRPIGTWRFGDDGKWHFHTLGEAEATSPMKLFRLDKRGRAMAQSLVDHIYNTMRIVPRRIEIEKEKISKAISDLKKSLGETQNALSS